MPCNKITLKQLAFAKKVVETQNSTEAAMQVYACKNRNSAANIASRLHRNPKVKAEIEIQLKEHSLTETTVFDKLREGLEANATAVMEGEVIQSSVPDMGTRLGYLKEAARIMDLYPPTRSENRSLNIDLELENMEPAKLAVLLRELAQNIHGEPTNKEKLGAGASSDANGAKVEGQE